MIVLDIVPEEQVQGALFDNVDRPKQAEIMKTMDVMITRITRRIGVLVLINLNLWQETKN